MKCPGLRPYCIAAAAVGLAVAGCQWAEALPERNDFETARRDATALGQSSRTFELLSRAAAQVAEYERRLTRLKSAESEDFRRFGAADDPRFVWAHEAECCILLMLAASETPPADPEARMKAPARLLLEFDQAVGWARLAVRRELPRDDARLEAALLMLRLSTGWEEERILSFDYSSLPEPGKAPRFSAPERSTAECGVETVRATLALLALTVESPMPGRSKIDAALKRPRAARIALAESYLRTAAGELDAKRSDDALALWRIALARLELEKVFPGR